MQESTWYVIAMIVYFLVMAAIGYWSYKQTDQYDDYVLGGRGLHPFVAALSAGASDMSGWLLMGLPGALFLSGMSELWMAIGLLVGYQRGTIPAAEPGTFDLGRFWLPLYVTALVVFLGVAVALLFLPQFTSNKWVFLGIVVLAAAPVLGWAAHQVAAALLGRDAATALGVSWAGTASSLFSRMYSSISRQPAKTAALPALGLRL